MRFVRPVARMHGEDASRYKFYIGVCRLMPRRPARDLGVHEQASIRLAGHPIQSYQSAL